MSKLSFVGTGSGGATPQTGAKRGGDHLVAAYANEVFQAAQQMESRLIGTCEMKSIEGSKKLFDTSEKLTYKTRRGGVRPTAFEAQVTGRREMHLRHWELATIVSDVDQYGSSIDLLQAYRKDLMSAQGRLIDSVLLNAMIGPAVIEDTSTAAVFNAAGPGASTAAESQKLGSILNNDDFHYTSVVEYKRRSNLYAALIKSGANYPDTGNAEKAFRFSSDNLTDITYIFQKRDVMDEPCATLTPEFKRILYKDNDFKDNEQVFRVGGDVNMQISAISYKGFKLIPVSQDILPKLGTHNVVRSVVGTSSGLLIKNLNADAVVAEPDIQSDFEVGAAVDADSAIKVGVSRIDLTDAELERASNFMVYFWCPKALYCSTSGVAKFRSEEIQDLRYDSAIYSIVPVSGMLIKEEYALQILLDPGSLVDADVTQGTSTVATALG